MIPLPLDRVAEIVGGELRAAAAAAVAGPAGGREEAPVRADAPGARRETPAPVTVIDAVSVDSRQLPRGALFVALPGGKTDGHAFLDQAAAAGAAAALVRSGTPPGRLPSIAVASPLAALQRLAAWYRRTHLGRVVAITGSNGKTVVKDALFTQVAGTFAAAASPGSFNSQLGVPLAVLAAPPGTAVAIFEAGISAPGEMASLAAILAPDCGILTNVGLAHIAAFEGRRQLAREKLSLFAAMAAGWLLLPADDPLIDEEAAGLPCRLARFPGDRDLPRLLARHPVSGPGGAAAGGAAGAEGAVARGAETAGGALLYERLEILFPSGRRAEVRLRTRSAEIVDDVMIAIGAAHLLGVPEERIAASLHDYAPPPTRLEVWRSPAGVLLVNDLVSADPISVRAALRTATELAGGKGRKVFVFGGMRELGAQAAGEYAAVGALAAEHGFDAFLLVADDTAPTGAGAAGAGDIAAGAVAAKATAGISPGAAAGASDPAGAGDDLSAARDAYLAARPGGETAILPGVEAVRLRLRGRLAPGDTLLLKGPRHGGIAAAALDLMDAMAPNRLIVDLGAVAGNVASFRRACGPRTRILAMVKALAYGSDLVRLSSWLSGAGIDHLGVSTADEGVELRRAGIGLPILVTLPTPEEAEKLARFELLPAVHSFALVEPLAAAARAALAPGRKLGVHLKVDTGMHRLGVAPHEAVALAQAAAATGALAVTGLMTHLAAAEDPAADGYTRRQLALFAQARADLAAAGFAGLLCHAAATAAAARLAEARFDMVRLGIGLFGIYPSPAVAEAIALQLAVTLLSRIAEIRSFAHGDRIGYGGTYTVGAERLRAGVVPLGYHDGVPWSLSNRGAVLVDGRPAPILGRISMDSLIVDLTAAPDAAAGSEALLFGALHGAVLRPEAVAEQAGTIPYELLARLGPRVQRVYTGF